jgi:hypothetical protein
VLIVVAAPVLGGARCAARSGPGIDHGLGAVRPAGAYRKIHAFNPSPRGAASTSRKGGLSFLPLITAEMPNRMILLD